MVQILLLSLGIVACLFLSNFFSASEMGYSSASVVRMEKLAENGDKRASRALKIINRFDDTLGAILIGNNLVNIASSSIASVLFIKLAGSDKNSWIATAVMTILVVIFGETIPKIRAKKKPNKLALRNSLAVHTLSILLWPIIRLVVFLVNLITAPLEGEPEEQDQEEAQEEAQAELASIVETAEEEGVLDEEETDLITAAIDFRDISAFEVMTARVDMEAVDIDDDWEEILAQIDATDCSRLPVYKDSIDNIIGILLVSTFLKEITEHPDNKPDLEKMLLKPCFIYKTAKLPDIMDELRKARQHLAIVADEYGGTLGVITMEDVLEELVGEIWDETDVIEEEVVERKTGDMEIDGDMPIGDFLELMEIPEDGFEADSDTVGGWACEMLGHFPEPGEEFAFQDEEATVILQITVLAMDGLRVEKILVHSIPVELED